MALSGTLDTSSFNTEWETIRTALKTHADNISLRQMGIKHLERWDVDSTTLMRDRSIIWLQPDDAIIRAFILQADAASGTANNVKATLEAVTDAGTVVTGLLPGDKVEIDASNIGTSITDNRKNYTTGQIPGLIGGRTYRLSVEMVTASVNLDQVRATLAYGVEHRR